ncbi:unnamed protein product [Caenorhabditis bovis]|uniref:Mitochondrial-processing peptidase subunit alpha n=1 Tax=Caenorhabditis bovis TaxID=2654633 RepID=A0A8S1FAJ1_9PELO|nr:unnamed protein product [Caenorhabditis bovis]
MILKLLSACIRRRIFHTSSFTTKNASRVPLSEPIKIGVEVKNAAKNVAANSEARITRLSNGLRVITEPAFGDFVTIGVAVESGCRYENGFPRGTVQMVEKTAFGASKKFPSRDDIFKVLEKNGGIIDCQSTRDTFMYASSCHRKGTDSVLEILANAVLNPLLTSEEIETAKNIIYFESLDMVKRIESIETLVTDYIHQAAFQGNTIGIPKYAEVSTQSDLNKLTQKHVASYLNGAHVPERMVVGGVGVDHDEFVSSVEKHFDWNTCSWKETPSMIFENAPEIDKSKAQYTGGEIRKVEDLTPLTIGTPYPLLSHVSLGFEGCSYKDDDFVPFCVLQSLLGGGGAFSAGGPGKGMYARLYTDVMNRHHWLYSAIAHNHSYSDSGLFTITSSCPPENINEALIVIADQFLRLRHGIDRQELERAKTQLRSHLMMNLEVRPVLFENMVRQLLGHDEWKNPEEYAEKIRAVSENDILRVSDRMLSTKPSLVGYGDVSRLAEYKLVDQSIAMRTVKPLFK